MPPVTTPPVLVAAAVAGVFLYAASSKVGSSTGLRTTLRELGVPGRWAGAGARIVPAFEVVVAVAVLGFAPAGLAVALLLLTAVAVAVAGTVGLARAAPIPCSCFSPRSSAPLGTRQLPLALLLATAAAALPAAHSRLELANASLLLACVSGGAIAVHLAAAAPDVRRAVRWRRLLSNGYPA